MFAAVLTARTVMSPDIVVRGPLMLASFIWLFKVRLPIPLLAIEAVLPKKMPSLDPAPKELPKPTKVMSPLDESREEDPVISIPLVRAVPGPPSPNRNRLPVPVDCIVVSPDIKIP